MMMRNILIAGMVLGSAAGVLVFQRRVLASTRSALEALKEKNLAAEENITEERNRIVELERRRAEQKEDLARLRAEVEMERLTHQPVSASLPDPREEGYWPKARPYFYLAKKDIPALEYQAINDSGRISAEAIALFGITSQERREIEMAMHEMFGRLRQAELENASLTNAPADVTQTKKGKFISVYLPANHDAEKLATETAGRVGEILGGKRANLFLERGAEIANQFDSFAPRDRIVTFIPREERKGEIIVTTESGSSYYFYDLDLDPGWALLQYGHLLNAFVFSAPR